MLNSFIEKGEVNFINVLSVPLKDRLAGLTKVYGEEKIHALIVVMLTDFASTFNVVRPMSPAQIVNCAFQLITTADEDQIGIEDLAIFFEGAKQGKYGKVYDRLDQQIIFEMFEVYREARHKTFMSFKEEQHAQYKSVPVNERFVTNQQAEEESKFRQALTEHMRNQFSEGQNRA